MASTLRNARRAALTQRALHTPLCVALLTGYPALAQTALSSMQGSVVNPPGAAVPHARVTVRNTSYGGPIRRHKLFFFVSVEKDLLQTPFYAAFDPQAPGTILPSSLSAQQGQVLEHHAPLAGFGRLDLNLNHRNTLSLDLGLDRVRSTNLGDGLSRSMANVAFASSFSGQSLTSRVGLSTALSGSMFNNAVVAWSSDHHNLHPNSTAPEQFVNGFRILGGSAAGQPLYTAHRTQVVDDLTLTRGQSASRLAATLLSSPPTSRRNSTPTAVSTTTRLPICSATTRAASSKRNSPLVS